MREDPMPEIGKCRCESITHNNHLGTRCGEPATTEDNYCKECHERAGLEHDLAKSEPPPVPR